MKHIAFRSRTRISFRACPGRRRPTCQRCQRATAAGGPRSKAALAEAFRVLDLPSQAQSWPAVRRAYLDKMKRLHPDVNHDQDTTAEAAEVTVAYQTIMEAHGDDRDWLEELDVFDHPNAPATEVFINPFRCDISPLEWQTLQQVACNGDGDPESRLMRAGLRLPSGAVQWLTPAQHLAVTDMMATMEELRSFESTAWIVNDCLLRAQRANARNSVFV